MDSQEIQLAALAPGNSVSRWVPVGQASACQVWRTLPNDRAARKTDRLKPVLLEHAEQFPFRGCWSFATIARLQ